MKVNALPRAIALLCSIALAALTLLASGCSTTSTPLPMPPVVVGCPVIPPLPASAQLPSSRSKTSSERVEELFNSWDEMMMKSLTTVDVGTASASPTTKP